MIQDTVDIFAISNPRTVNTNEEVPISVIVMFVSVADQEQFARTSGYDTYAGESVGLI